VAEYAKHFTCTSIDLRGTGETDKPECVYPSSFSPTVSPHSCKLWGSRRRTSPACRSARPVACGWRPNILIGSSHCLSTVGGRRHTVPEDILPLVLHARAICCQARARPALGRICAGPASAACLGTFLQESNVVIVLNEILGEPRLPGSGELDSNHE
jgi:hypothetical protein